MGPIESNSESAPAPTLGVIPARGGSKGIKRKNLQEILGKPIIAYAIEAATASNTLSRVVVSTDDPEIADVALALGADVPFRRPEHLATDRATSIQVVKHALALVEQLDGRQYQRIAMLQPTTPFRLAADIDSSVLLAESTACDSVISVCEVGGHHPSRMKLLSHSGQLIDPPFAEESENQNRQGLEPMYIRNGAIYLTNRTTLLAGSFKGRVSMGYVMPPERSFNIDTPLDLALARAYAEYLHA